LPLREFRIDDPATLRSLIAQYRRAVIFREALPAAYDMAKMFMTLRNSNGGLVLFGVSAEGAIIGLREEELARARERLEHLAAELCSALVEIGRVELEGKVAMFAIFNPIPAHTRPLETMAAATSAVVVV
jgi:GTPase